ncbi:TrbI/VirB10 family protein [Sphingobium aquiterrae]|uniref:TrbI/VirB10 family protein n=1 Tax=Sphingobium aquiterrae TaxID=2038656 RepID=UPI0030161123
MSEAVEPAAASSFRLRGDQPRVMRLSRKALAVVGVAAGLGIGGSLIYALQPHKQGAAKELFSTDSRTTADTIASAPKDYTQAPRLGPPLPGDLGRPILSAQQRGADVPPPPIGAPAPPAGPQANAAEAARQRAAQERDAARTSRLFLGGSVAASDTAPAIPPSAAKPGVSDTAIAPQSGDAAPGDQAGKRAFLARQSNSQTVSAERLSAPVSPYVLQAGSIIPAALITGIRSDLPGQITAQVTQNVYDSPTGRVLLIPQGSRLIGEYDSQVSFGQNRVLLAWDRLILPGGRSIVLERQPGADTAGMAGLQDGTNYHWGQIAKAALISTLLGVGTELGNGSDDELTRALRRGTQDTLNQTGQQIVRQQLDIQPTLTIRPGYPLRVIVTRDLILETVGGGR